MTTFSKKRKTIEPGTVYRAAKKRRAYPAININSDHRNSNSKDQLAFVVPWQISDDQKDSVSY
ncbi:MAG: hypothetical protein ACOC2M_00675 [bacterium]